MVMPMAISGKDIAPILEWVSRGFEWLGRKQMYVWKTEDTIEKLKKTRNELEDSIHDVLENIKDAKHNGWAPKHEAEGWVREGQEIMRNADVTMEKFSEQLEILLDTNINLAHFIHCPCNALSRRVLIAEAITRFINIKEHKAQGKIYLTGTFDDVAYKRGPRVNVVSPPPGLPPPVEIAHLKTPLLNTQPSLKVDRQKVPNLVGHLKTDPLINTQPSLKVDKQKDPIASASDNTSVKLSATAQYGALARAQSHDMPVMIRVKAPRHARRSRAPVDLVLILDVSSSSERLEQVKQGVLFVVHNLEVEDRLSILQSSQARARVLFPLTDMSDPHKTMARNKIKRLAIIDHSHTADIESSMETAYKILQDRPDRKKRVSGIMLLTDGSDKNMDIERLIGRYPTYTFGIGFNHDSCMMYELATWGGGTYSFVEGQDSNSITDSVALCIGGLTSVVAQSIKISISSAQPDVKISSISCGAYDHELKDASCSITIDDLCSSEEKNFLVYVKVPVLKGFRRTTKLLTVKANYYCLVTAKSDVETAPVEVSIKRPIKVRSQPISDEVRNEAFRADVLEKVNEIWPNGGDMELETISEKLKDIQESIEIDPHQGDIGIREDIREDLDEMQETSTGLPYMLSWLSSHQWQRAATLGSTSTTTFSFKTGRMQNMIDSVETAQVVQDC